MKFAVHRNELYDALSRVKKVIVKNPVMSILVNVRLTVDKDTKTLRVYGSESETSMEYEIDVIEPSESGSIAVRADLLYATVQTSPEVNLVFEVHEDKGQVEITFNDGLQGKNYIALAPVNEFMEEDRLQESEVQTLVTNTEILSNGFNYTHFATTKPGTPPNLECILMKVGQGAITFVATDGGVLSHYTYKGEEFNIDTDILIRNKTFELLVQAVCSSRDPQPVEIRFDDRNIEFKGLNFRFVCRLLTNTYPEYENTLETPRVGSLSVDRKLFQNALQQLTPYAQSGVDRVKFTLGEEQLKLSTTSIGVSNGGNSAERTLPCAIEGIELSNEEDAPTEWFFSMPHLNSVFSRFKSNSMTFEEFDDHSGVFITPSELGDENEDIIILMVRATDFDSMPL